MANDASGLGQNDPRVRAYLESTFGPEDAVLAEIRERSKSSGLPDIQVARFDGRHLEVLARSIAARRIVEIGTLGGYSGVCLARGLAGGGRLDTFEYDPLHAEVARESFRRAKVADRVRVHVGRALDLLPRIESDGAVDVVFVDADKESYPAYLDWARANLRPGGVILADNVFRAAFGATGGWSEASVSALDRFNRELVHGGGFVATFIPTVEGLAMGVKV
jgi:predicted O-methyltransferase YrrM